MWFHPPPPPRHPRCTHAPLSALSPDWCGLHTWYTRSWNSPPHLLNIQMLSAAFKRHGRSDRHLPAFQVHRWDWAMGSDCLRRRSVWLTGRLSYFIYLPFVFFNLQISLYLTGSLPDVNPLTARDANYYRSGLYLNSIKGPLQHKHDQSLWLFLITSIQHADYPPAYASLQVGLSGCATVPLGRGRRKRGVGEEGRPPGCGESALDGQEERQWPINP